MKECSHCQITVNSKRKTCPLCYRNLVEKEGEVAFSDYPKKTEKRRVGIAFKIGIFLSLIACIVCAVVNYLSFDESPYYWSVVVIIAIAYLWLSIRYVIMGRGLITTRIFFEAITTIVLVGIIEYCIVFHNLPSTSFTITFVSFAVLTAALLAIYLIVFINKKLFIDSIIIIFYIALLSFIPLIIDLTTDIIEVSWPPIALSLVGVSALLALFVFNFKDTIEELKKRLHI